MHFSIFFLTALCSSLLAVATPIDTGDGCPMDQNYEDCIYKKNSDPKTRGQFCYAWRKRIATGDGKITYAMVPNDGLNDCVKQCTAVHGPQQPGQTITCGLPPGGTYSWNDNKTIGADMESCELPCNCDDKVVGAFGDAFVKLLPHIGDVICDVWVAALTGIVDYFIDSGIDSVETAISSLNKMGDITQNHKDIFQTAAMIQHATTDLEKGKDAFGKWVASKVCPAGELSQDQVNSIFKTVNDCGQMIAAVVTLPAGGEILSAVRYAGDLPKLADGADLLKALPKEWSGPKAKPDHPIEPKPKPKPTDPVKPTKPSDPAAKPTTKPDEKPTSNGKLSDSQKQTTPTSTPHEQSSNKPTDSKTSTPASTTSEKQTSSAKSTSSTTTTSSGKSSSQSQSSTSSSQQSGSSSSQTQLSTSSSQQSSSSHSGSSTSSQQSSSSSASSSSSGSSNGIHKTIVQSSVSAIQTVTKTCDAAKYPQACAHYYSASTNNPSVAKLTCADGHKPATTVGPAGVLWDGQHQNKKFSSYVKTQYQDPADKTNKPLQCERCQWPPADLLSNGDKQQVRNLPGGENSGTNDMWKNFCMLHDGGKDNGQRLGNQVVALDEELFALNPALVKTKAPITTTSAVGKDKITTYETTYDTVTFTRAVFEMAFDWAGKEAPSAGNNWHLTDNPCWPSDIVPKDPGYVLLADDAWYSNAGNGFWKMNDIKLQNGTIIYNLNPSDDLQKAADLKRPDLVVAGQSRSAGAPNTALNDSPGLGIKKPGARVRRAAALGDDLAAAPAQHHQCKLSLEDRGHDPWCDGELKPSKPAVNVAVPTLIHTTIGKPAQKEESDLSILFPVATSA